MNKYDNYEWEEMNHLHWLAGKGRSNSVHRSHIGAPASSLSGPWAPGQRTPVCWESQEHPGWSESLRAQVVQTVKISNHRTDIFNYAATNCFIASALGKQQGIGWGVSVCKWLCYSDASCVSGLNWLQCWGVTKESRDDSNLTKFFCSFLNNLATSHNDKDDKKKMQCFCANENKINK